MYANNLKCKILHACIVSVRTNGSTGETTHESIHWTELHT